MKSYINLKNKLDKLDNEQETTNQKMIEALSSIYKKIKNQNKKLSEIVPQNVEIISMSKLINRIEIIKTEILSSPISEIKKIELLKAIDENLTNLNDINYTKKDITNKIIKIEILLHQRKEYVKEKYEKVKKINERLNP